MTINDITGMVSDATTVVGVVVGGLWAYYLFIRGRTHSTKAQLEHGEIAPLKLTNGFYCKVPIKLTNTGNVAIYPWLTDTRSHAITAELPAMQEGELRWPLIARHAVDHVAESFVLEPGESAVWFVDHVVPAGCEAIEVYTQLYIGKRRKHSLDASTEPKHLDRLEQQLLDDGYVWETTTVVDLHQ